MERRKGSPKTKSGILESEFLAVSTHAFYQVKNVGTVDLDYSLAVLKHLNMKMTGLLHVYGVPPVPPPPR